MRETEGPRDERGAARTIGAGGFAPPTGAWAAGALGLLAAGALLLSALALPGPFRGLGGEAAPAEGAPPAQEAVPPRDAPAARATGTPRADYGIVIHGGAGTIRRQDVSPEREAEYHAALEEALRAGYRVLEDGGSALDAVQAAVVIMEDSPLFNAGRGAVFTREGTNELDAAIMDGRTGDAGAVAGLTTVRNPIRLARLVMEESPHVFLVGEGAQTFGREHGIEEVDPSYFRTEARWESLQRLLELERARGGSEDGAADTSGEGSRDRAADAFRGDSRRGTADAPAEDRASLLGTVGAVALDRDGNVAAATSTGGLTGKRFGRVGDVPVIGAGTYAGEGCAISGTGHGEFFIRNVVAHDICARVAYADASLENAARQVVMEELVAQEADGGVIGIDRGGAITLTFNTPGMYRGHMLEGEEPVTAIFGKDG